MKHFFLPVIAFLLFILPATAQWTPEKATELENYLAKISEKNKAMGSLALMEGDEVVYTRGFGYSDVASKTTPDASTIYHVGSISKIYTSILIHHLVEQKRLALDDKLSEFYPKVKNADKITISDLLNHRSGIFNFTNAPSFGEIYTKPIARETHLQMIYDFDSVFEPGSKAEYSNSNYLLLANIIEDVSGKNYEEVLEKAILKPLKTKRTTFGKNLGSDKNEARSYSFEEKTWTANPETDMSIPFGAGSIRSTPTELVRFGKALFDGEFVNQSSLKSMSDLMDDYGRGLFGFPYNDKIGLGHNGGIDGFQAHLSHFAEDDLTFALTLNGANYSMNKIMLAVLTIYFGDDFQMPDLDAVEVPSHVLESYAGVYTSDEVPIEVTLFVEDGILKGSVKDQEEIKELRPSSNTTFHDDEEGVVVEFDKEGSFKFEQDGFEGRFNRTEGTSKVEQDSKNYTTSLSIFGGTYISSELPVDIDVRMRDNQLFAQATGQGELPLSRTGETTFVFDQAGIVMEFDGEKGFVLKQGGGTYTFSKK